ncbi:MAG TPA: ABC transporter ATP-binding protein [Streptosporangiaceae bacterium]
MCGRQPPSGGQPSTVTLWTPFPDLHAAPAAHPLTARGAWPAGGMLASPAEDVLASRLTDEVLASAVTDEVLIKKLTGVPGQMASAGREDTWEFPPRSGVSSGHVTSDGAGPAVWAEGLVVRRSRQVVLDGLTFAIQAGEVTGLLGPSGCGKTTLMRTLVGVQVITAGRVEILGLPPGDPQLRGRAGYATQGPAVYADATLVENLRYFGTVLGLGRASLESAIAHTVAELGLGGLERRLVGTFSGGELARVGLGVALLGKPALLVLDEPTVGLDPVLRRDLWAMFHRLAGEGAAVLVSSHVMDEAARCDRLLFMREGKFLAADTPKALLVRTGAATLEEAFLDLATEPQVVQR